MLVQSSKKRRADDHPTEVDLSIELRHKLSAALTKIEELQLERKRDGEESDMRSIEEARKRQVLEKKVEFLLSQESKVTAKLEEAEAAARTAQAAATKSKQELSELLRKETAGKREAELVVRQLRQEITACRSPQAGSESDKDIIRCLHSQLADSQQTILKLSEERQRSAHLATELEVAKQNVTSLTNRVKILNQNASVAGAALSQEETLRLNHLERQNRVSQRKIAELTEQASHVEVLREEIADLKERLARYGPVHQSNGVLQSQLAHAESINKQWRDLLSDTLGLQLQEDVNAVVTHVKALQEESAQQNSARARLETQLKLLQVQLKDEFARSQLLAQQHQDRLSQLTTASSALQAAQRQLANATKQRDAYKTALDSYNEFEAAPARDEARQTQLKEQSDQLQSAQAELAALKLEREVLQSEVKHLSQHLTRVEAENTVLYSKVSSGEFDPTNTKVWHFKANPAAQAVSELRAERERQTKRLTAEVSRLTALLSQTTPSSFPSSSSMIISPGIGNSRGSDGSESLEKMNYGVCLSSGTMLSEVSMLSDNIDTWRKRLETAEEKAKEQEKLNARLREIFAQKIKEFRQDCYEITGYKITMTENGRKFRLRSMYAEREEDDLLFTKENEVLQVLETPFVRGLESRVTEVLSRFNSIPLFLSSVTEYLFERQTRRT